MKITSSIGGATIHAQTGAPQLSGDDITDKMDLLVSKYKKDSRLFDAFQELKDDLLDDTAWPVVMQWFNEDPASSKQIFI